MQKLRKAQEGVVTVNLRRRKTCVWSGEVWDVQQASSESRRVGEGVNVQGLSAMARTIGTKCHCENVMSRLGN